MVQNYMDCYTPGGNYGEEDYIDGGKSARNEVKEAFGEEGLDALDEMIGDGSIKVEPYEIPGLDDDYYDDIYEDGDIPEDVDYNSPEFVYHGFKLFINSLWG